MNQSVKGPEFTKGGGDRLGCEDSDIGITGCVKDYYVSGMSQYVAMKECLDENKTYKSGTSPAKTSPN
jgi:hypothetical protein